MKKLSFFKNKHLSRRGQLNVLDSLSQLAIGAVVFGITIVVVFLMMGELSTNTTVSADTNATAAVNTINNSLDDIPDWLPIIIIVVIGALLIGLVSVFRR